MWIMEVYFQLVSMTSTFHAMNVSDPRGCGDVLTSSADPVDVLTSADPVVCGGVSRHGC